LRFHEAKKLKKASEAEKQSEDVVEVIDEEGAIEK
jgi:hypothetical protein